MLSRKVDAEFPVLVFDPYGKIRSFFSSYVISS